MTEIEFLHEVESLLPVCGWGAEIGKYRMRLATDTRGNLWAVGSNPSGDFGVWPWPDHACHEYRRVSVHEAYCPRIEQARSLLAEKGIHIGFPFRRTRGNLSYMVWKIDDLDDPQSLSSPLTTRGWDADYDPEEIARFPDYPTAVIAALKTLKESAHA